MTIAVSVSACGSGSDISSVGAAAEERRYARLTHHDEQQQVRGVAEQQEPDEHAREAALEHGVDAAGEEHGHDHDEDERDIHQVLTPCRELVSSRSCLRLAVDLGTEAAQHVEHEADHDEVDADVEQRRGDEFDVADDRQVDLEEGARERRGTEEHRHDRAGDRDRHAGAEQAPGVGRRGGAELVPAARDVAHDERHARDESAGEAAAGQVVTGEQQVQRHDDDRVEEDPHDHLEDDRAVLGSHALTADEPRRATHARARRWRGLMPSLVSTSGRRRAHRRRAAAAP